MEIFLSRLNIEWQNFNWYIAVAIFVSFLLIDGLYARYTFEVVKLKAFSAASISFATHFLLAFGIINYVDNFLYVFPVAIGSWLGTFFVVKREKHSRIKINPIPVETKF